MLIDFCLRRDTPIHEDVSLSGMAVKVTEEENLVVLMAHLKELLGVVDRWVQELAGVWPATIEVGTYEVASVVSVYDAIWV